MRRLTAILVLLSQFAAASEIPAHWRDLAAIVTGKDVIVNRQSGNRVRGVTLSVEANSINLETRKAGRQSVARADVRDIRVARNSYRWRAIGAAAGAGAGTAAAIPVLAETHNEGSGRYDAAAAGVIAGLAILGFMLGWRADRGRDLVTILPD